MSVGACAALVQRGDPDRFRATMAAPVAARAVLFPIYAANLEAARAPWASEEPLIAEMRLQWWADTLEAIAAGGPIRRHEVVWPLADILDAEGARLLGRGVQARRRDARRAPPETVEALCAYLDDTAGALTWAATRALAARGPDAVDGADAGGETGDRPDDRMRRRAMAVGRLSGLANYLLAVPDLLARGLNPLPEMSEAAFATLLRDTGAAAGPVRAPCRVQRIAELPAWRARGVLARALRDPAAVVEGRLDGAPAAARAALLWRSFRL